MPLDFKLIFNAHVYMTIIRTFITTSSGDAALWRRAGALVDEIAQPVLGEVQMVMVNL